MPQNCETRVQTAFQRGFPHTDRAEPRRTRDDDGAQDQPNMEMLETLKAQMALMEQVMSGKKLQTSATKRKTPDLRMTRAVVKKRATR